MRLIRIMALVLCGAVAEGVLPAQAETITLWCGYNEGASAYGARTKLVVDFEKHLVNVDNGQRVRPARIDAYSIEYNWQQTSPWNGGVSTVTNYFRVDRTTGVLSHRWTDVYPGGSQGGKLGDLHCVKREKPPVPKTKF